MKKTMFASKTMHLFFLCFLFFFIAETQSMAEQSEIDCDAPGEIMNVDLERGGVITRPSTTPGGTWTESYFTFPSRAKTSNPEKDQNEGAEAEEEDDEEDEFGEDLEAEFGKTLSSKRCDHFRTYNIAVTAFNDKLYYWVLQPVAKGYRWVMPDMARRGVENFFDNLLFPLRFTNNLLQLKFKNAGIEFLRFCINTTLGVFGFWDPAKEWFGLEKKEEDFGQTLGYWGVGPGPHIVVPFFGPSNLRDVFSMAPDYALNARRNIEPPIEEFKVKVYEVVNETSNHIGEYENLKKDALEDTYASLYTFFRDVYEQNRKKQIEE